MESQVQCDVTWFQDAKVLEVLDNTEEIIGVEKVFHSRWALSSRLNVVQKDKSQRSYFIKKSRGHHGREALRGEYESTLAVYTITPDFCSKPAGWGTFASDPCFHFYLCEFIELRPGLPAPLNFCEKLARLHSFSTSSNGMLGFHVTTYNGYLPQDNTWCDSWEGFFANALRHVLNVRQERAGPCAELDELLPVMFEKVIPRLLRPLETGGNTIKPSLVHGDLWCGNAAIIAKNKGDSVVYDPASFWAHNEYELGNWRPKRNKFSEDYFDAYHDFFPEAAPKEDADDRNALYAMRFNLNAATLFPTDTTYLDMVMDEMRILIPKFPEGYVAKVDGLAVIVTTVAATHNDKSGLQALIGRMTHPSVPSPWGPESDVVLHIGHSSPEAPNPEPQGEEVGNGGRNVNRICLMLLHDPILCHPELSHDDIGSIRYTEQRVKEAVKLALRLGYRHIDGASAYGNEKEIGQSIRESPVAREELFVTSKLAQTWHSPSVVAQALDETLADLQLDYVPHAYQSDENHNTVRHSSGNGKPAIDYELSRNYAATWEAMEALVDSGKAKAIGVSNFNVLKLRKPIATARIIPAVNQVELHPYLPQTDLVNFCQDNGVTVTARAVGVLSTAVTATTPYRPSVPADPFLAKQLPRASRSMRTRRVQTLKAQLKQGMSSWQPGLSAVFSHSTLSPNLRPQQHGLGDRLQPNLPPQPPRLLQRHALQLRLVPNHVHGPRGLRAAIGAHYAEFQQWRDYYVALPDSWDATSRGGVVNTQGFNGGVLKSGVTSQAPVGGYFLVEEIDNRRWITEIRQQNTLPSSVQLPKQGDFWPCDADSPDQQRGAASKLILRSVSAGNVVLMLMHSYGGAVGTAAVESLTRQGRAAQGQPGGVVHLFYLCAYLLAAGQSIRKIIARSGLWGRARRSQDLDPEDQLEQNNLIVPHHMACASGEAVHEGVEAHPEHISYVRTTENRCVPPQYQDIFTENVREAGATVAVEVLECGHSAYAKHPNGVADLVVIACSSS
ncbi:Uu.00g128130.m01.CDS01 [Anthostomella pinea]|uniref:protein-ribulosamine 3-kinase n=1 Tax=Anthostomella pinea TaxID=933095 RepID=A0AAI8VI89_9PEZI|nr:Uu.00g128130.m01.CDS01 [Anthostomella pinea]